MPAFISTLLLGFYLVLEVLLPFGMLVFNALVGALNFVIMVERAVSNSNNAVSALLQSIELLVTDLNVRFFLLLIVESERLALNRAGLGLRGESSLPQLRALLLGFGKLKLDLVVGKPALRLGEAST